MMFKAPQNKITKKKHLVEWNLLLQTFNQQSMYNKYKFHHHNCLLYKLQHVCHPLNPSFHGLEKQFSNSFSFLKMIFKMQTIKLTVTLSNHLAKILVNPNLFWFLNLF